MRALQNASLFRVLVLAGLLIGSVATLFCQTVPLRLNPPGVSFAPEVIGSVSGMQSVTVTNDGPAAVVAPTVSITGGFAADFDQTNNCASALAPGGSCTIQVVFRPIGTGPRTSTLWVVAAAGTAVQGSLSGAGTGQCASISECAYQLLLQRTAANYAAFFVYKDGDSPFNHGFPSGLFASNDVAYNAIIIDADCVESLSSPSGCSKSSTDWDAAHGTVLRVGLPVLAHEEDFAGLNIVDPQGYVPGDGSNGYDLRSATAVQFDVRSPSGANVQFGVGGCVSEFFSIPSTWTTVTMPIASLYPPSGGTFPCPPDLTNTHILFTVATNGVQSPRGAMVLVDNVQFTPTPARQSTQLSLPLSNQTFGVVSAQVAPFPTDQANRNAAALYEASLSVLTLLWRGQPNDVAAALGIADALDYALHHENHGDPVPSSGANGLHNAYMAGDIALLNGQGTSGAQAGDVRLAGFSGGGICGSSGFCLVEDGATGGNNAWAIFALAAAYLQSGSQKYLEDAEMIGNWITSMLVDKSSKSYGGYFVGFNDASDKGLQSPNYGKSTENNADIFGALSLLSQIEGVRGNASLAQQCTISAQIAGDFVMQMFDHSVGKFYVGTVTYQDSLNPGPGNCPLANARKGNDVVNMCDFLDSSTFTTLPMAAASRYQHYLVAQNEQMDWRRPVQYILNFNSNGSFLQGVMSNGHSFQGFDLIPSGPGSGDAWEFTGQMVETCRYLDLLLDLTTFETCAHEYVSQIAEAQMAAPFGDGMGLVASVLQNGYTAPVAAQCLVTPFQCIPERVGLAATNWAIIAEQGFNPMAYASASPNYSALAFPSQLVGTQSVALTLKVENSGTAPLIFGKNVAITGVNPADFTETDNCLTGRVFLPGTNCSIIVVFQPSASGARAATLSISSNSLAGEHSIGLSGSGLPADDFSLRLSPSSRSIVAGSSATYMVIAAIARGSAQSINLAVGALPSGVTASFAANPISSGSSSQLTVVAGAGVTPGSYSVAITGASTEADHGSNASLTVQAPIALSGSSLNFGTQAIAGTSVPQTITLTNISNTALPVTPVVLGGTFPGDYLESDNCGAALASGAVCMVNLTFAPTGAGPRPALLFLDPVPGHSAEMVTLTGAGAGTCGAISDCALGVLNQRADANQMGFLVYQDADSPFNHGFGSGVFGSVNPPVDTSKVVIDAGCIDDPLSTIGCSSDVTSLSGTRGTVFRVTFPPLTAGQFVGLNFQEPLDYVPGDGSIGYNLPLATSVRFDVRSTNGASVQFGVGGCVTRYYAIAPTWSTMTMDLGTLFDPNTGAHCMPNLSDIHILFAVDTDYQDAAAGATVLLDNIQFLPVPSRNVPSLPLSTETLGVIPQLNYPIPTDQVNRNLSTVYESSLTILALLKRGSNSDIINALAIADSLDFALHHDNHGDPVPAAPGASVALHSSYEAGALPLLNNQAPNGAGLANDVRLSGFSAGTSLCGSTGFCLVLDGSSGGNNAWAMVALIAAYEQSGNATYLSDAEAIGTWIANTLFDKSNVSYGGYFIGFSDGGSPKVPILGKSTEQNAEIFAAFSLLTQVENSLGNQGAAARWTLDAKAAGDFVMKMFDKPHARFYTGTIDSTFSTTPGPGICPSKDPSQQNGSDLINTCDFLTADSIPVLALAGSSSYRSLIDWTGPLRYVLGLSAPLTFTQVVAAAGTTFQGFNLVPAAPASGVDWERTAQAVVSMQALANIYGASTFSNEINSYLHELQLAQASAPFGDGKGLVAATLQNGQTATPYRQCLVTPFQCAPERVGIAATAWAFFADQGFNPLVPAVR